MAHLEQAWKLCTCNCFPELSKALEKIIEPEEGVVITPLIYCMLIRSIDVNLRFKTVI